MATGADVLDQLLDAALLLQRDLARAFEGTQLTTARTHLLWELRRLGPSTQQSLAVALEVSPRNITGLVDALEIAGYVARKPHPTDRRATLVGLTDLGVSTMVQMERDHCRLGDQLVADLDQKDIDQLSAGLRAVGRRLRELVEPSETPGKEA